MPRSGVLAAALLSVGLCAGCGNARTPVPSLTQPATGGTLRSFSYPGDGLSFRAPRSWMVIAEPPPLVTVLASGGAVVSVWRYPRNGRAPADAAQLEAARRAVRGRRSGRVLRARPLACDLGQRMRARCGAPA